MFLPATGWEVIDEDVAAGGAAGAGDWAGCASAAAQSRKPHYLLYSRPGVMDRALVAQLREHGIAVVGGLREGLSAIDRLARLTSRTNS